MSLVQHSNLSPIQHFKKDKFLRELLTFWGFSYHSLHKLVLKSLQDWHLLYWLSVYELINLLSARGSEILTLLLEIKENQAELRQECQEIRTLINGNNLAWATKETPQQAADLPVSLPMKSMEDFNSVEEWPADKDNRTAMVSQYPPLASISKIGLQNHGCHQIILQ